MPGLLILLGGLAGASGVGLSALAAHYPGGANLATAAQMLLVHAPVFLALAALVHQRALPGWVLGLAALVLLAGLSLFAGDLARRVFSGERLFQGAAPLGGSLMIGGWVWLALAGLFSRLKRAKSD
jgi:uncharacterized membrane protein YgdD (TMEM256/DUF423 family)